MKLEAGKFYKTRDGRKAFVEHLTGLSPFAKGTCIYPTRGWIDDNEWDHMWTHDGQSNQYQQCNSEDLVAEWVDSIKVEGWVNVYEEGKAVVLYASKAQADNRASTDRIACIFVSGTEDVCP